MSGQPSTSFTPSSAADRGTEAGAHPRPDPLQQREQPLTREDEIVEQMILTQVILHHPAKLMILELAIKVETDCEHLAETDIVERAVRELSRGGLLQCDGWRIWPTEATLRFDALLGGGV